MKMKKGTITATIDMDYIRFYDSVNGAKWKEPTRHNNKSQDEVINCHVRSLKLRGYECEKNNMGAVR